MACVIGCIDSSDGSDTLAYVYDTKGAEVIQTMVNGKKSNDTPSGLDHRHLSRTAVAPFDVDGEEPAAYSNSYSLAAARRFLGMDESDIKFTTVLRCKPDILVEDFDEEKLGLLRLSFNLNPAMVAKVMAWNRSMF